MLVATLLGVGMAWRRGNWLSPLVVAWAVFGIGASAVDQPILANGPDPTGLTAVYFAVALASAASKAKRAASSPLMRRVSSP